MTDNSEAIKCMILTLRSENVIVPSASVAEMISAQGAKGVKDVPDWYVGKMRWHGADVPLVSFEAASGDDAKEINQNTQIAVIYTASSNELRYPYFGLVVSGVPHLTQFTREQIVAEPKSLTNVYQHPMVVEKARINGAAVSILNIDGIESMITRAEMH